MSATKGKKKREVTSYCDWMSQLPPELHNIPLFNLAIPGSHDSMSYDLDINSCIIEPDLLRRFSKIYCARKTVRRWALTQEETITKQLDAGVRYFDLRIARKRNETDPTRLYFYHGLYTHTDVEDTPTLKKCWDQGRNIIVSYDWQAKRPLEIWTEIIYYYGNSMDPTKVESNLRQQLEKGRPSRHFFVCGLNLTLPGDAKILKYVLRLCDNLPNVIRRSLPRLLRWVKEQAGRTPMNIVASDLATRGDFVSAVVELNISKRV
ncbi:PI-PLC X domain-containing protein 1-like isoform X2 [Sparus aurata]|uniref:PI-PLC X domain-containing protein 1-like isoform X2 n=1 Tax=Sparus aurata TaxID=8175 RepID=UPI0011C11F54|nr:PI-PLC X domain-containing protein 1-like isoform X2 [Sparus aurata]